MQVCVNNPSSLYHLIPQTHSLYTQYNMYRHLGHCQHKEIKPTTKGKSLDFLHILNVQASHQYI